MTWEFSKKYNKIVWFDDRTGQVALDPETNLPVTPTQHKYPQVTQAEKTLRERKAPAPASERGTLPQLQHLEIGTNATSKSNTKVRTFNQNNAETGVRSRLQYGPTAEKHCVVMGDPEREEEQLWPTFRKRPKSFFKRLRVFAILWVEPASDFRTLVSGRIPNERHITIGKLNQRVFNKFRRFVVVVEGQNSCQAIPIATHEGKGVAKQARKSDFGIVHTGAIAPRPTADEEPQRGENGMQPLPIRIDPDDPTEKLDPMSRLNYGKIYVIEHNVKVRPFGMVSRDSELPLFDQFKNVFLPKISSDVTPRRANFDPNKYSVEALQFATSKALMPRLNCPREAAMRLIEGTIRESRARLQHLTPQMQTWEVGLRILQTQRMSREGAEETLVASIKNFMESSQRAILEINPVRSPNNDEREKNDDDDEEEKEEKSDMGDEGGSGDDGDFPQSAHNRYSGNSHEYRLDRARGTQGQGGQTRMSGAPRSMQDEQALRQQNRANQVDGSRRNSTSQQPSGTVSQTRRSSGPKNNQRRSQT